VKGNYFHPDSQRDVIHKVDVFFSTPEDLTMVTPWRWGVESVLMIPLMLIPDTPVFFVGHDI